MSDSECSTSPGQSAPRDAFRCTRLPVDARNARHDSAWVAETVAAAGVSPANGRPAQLASCAVFGQTLDGQSLTVYLYKNHDARGIYRYGAETGQQGEARRWVFHGMSPG